MKSLILGAAKLILLIASIVEFTSGDTITAIYLAVMILVLEDAYKKPGTA